MTPPSSSVDQALRLRLLSLAADALARVRRTPQDSLTVSVEDDQRTLTLTLVAGHELPTKGRPSTPRPDPTPFLLTAIEVQIVRAVLAATSPMKGSTVASRLGLPADSQFRAQLRRLVEAGILENGDDGYAVAEPFSVLVPHIPGLSNDVA